MSVKHPPAGLYDNRATMCRELYRTDGHLSRAVPYDKLTESEPDTWVRGADDARVQPAWGMYPDLPAA